MGFGAAVSSVLSNYVGFQGRARRSEYWWWVLAYLIILIAASILDMVIDPPPPGVMFHYGVIYSLAALAMFLPTLAVGIRRLHDTDHSGWWILIGIVPILGWILLLYWYCIRGTVGQNKFGADPVA